jgi:DNA ligase 1
LTQSQVTSDVGPSSFILDAEIIAIDPSTGQIKPFQELSSRARKDVELREVKVAVAVYLFDLMLLNDKV